MNAAPEKTSGVVIAKCDHCSSLHFPPRRICHRCGNDIGGSALTSEAIVEEVTTVSHMVGRQDVRERHLATVRTVEGLLMVVGIDTPIATRAKVILESRDGVPFAREC